MDWDDLANKYDHRFYFIDNKSNWEIYDKITDEFVSKIDPSNMTPNFINHLISKYIINKRNTRIDKIFNY